MCQFAQGFHFQCPGRSKSNKGAKETAGCGRDFFQAQNIWTEAYLVDSLRRRVGLVESLKRAIKTKPPPKKEKQRGDEYEQALLEYLKYKSPRGYERLLHDKYNIMSIVREIFPCAKTKQHGLTMWDYYDGKVFTKYCEQCGRYLQRQGVKKGREQFPDPEEPRWMPMVGLKDLDFSLRNSSDWKQTARLEWMKRDNDDHEDDRDSFKEPIESDAGSLLTIGKAPPSVWSTSEASSLSKFTSSSVRHSESLDPSVSELDEYDDRPSHPRIYGATRNSIFPRTQSRAAESLYSVSSAHNPPHEGSEQRSETTSASRYSAVAADSSALSSRTDRTVTSGVSDVSSGRTSTAIVRCIDGTRSEATSASYTTYSGQDSSTPRHPARSSTVHSERSSSTVSPQHHHTTRSGIPHRANTYHDPPPLPTARPSAATGHGRSAAYQDTRHVGHVAPGSSDEEKRRFYGKYYDEPWKPPQERESYKRRERKEAMRATSPYPMRSKQLEEWADYDEDEESEVVVRRGSMIPGMDPRPSRSRSRSQSRSERRQRSRSQSSSADIEPRDNGKGKKGTGKKGERNERRRRRWHSVAA